MPTDVSRALSALLGVPAATIRTLDEAMVLRGFPAGVPERLLLENSARVRRALGRATGSARDIRELLRARIGDDERKLKGFLGTLPSTDTFDRAAAFARSIAKVGTGYFLKRDRAANILTERPPRELLDHFGASSINEILAAHDVTEIMSALRFTEPTAWMHETFDAVYRRFTADDFEERPIEVKVLSSVWRKVAEAFVTKKHHNVSHLKEFGVIFLNPIAEDVPGAFVRDFSLLLHYFHEIEFYAKLFRRAAALPGFPDRFTSLLRGDVPDTKRVKPGEWLIVQRYLVKEDPGDPRLALPRVNPESLHWLRGERDLTTCFAPGFPDLSFWNGLDWVGNLFPNDGIEPVSFDLEDSAMSLVSFTEGRDESFGYHQREAMWTRLFEEYVGGEAKMEQLLIENFDRGVVRL